MRILLTAKHPPGGKTRVGGVQTWINTVKKELVELGHEVNVWGPEWALPEGRFHLGIISNFTSCALSIRLCDKVTIVSHGIVEAEIPAFSLPTIFTSEEIRDFWRKKGPIVRQPIDLDFWVPGNEERKTLTRHSYRQGLSFLFKIARTKELDYYHLSGSTPEQVRDKLQRSLIVVATGRAALEAMACGAAVVIADDREYQGPLLDFDRFGSMRRNYSGRGGITPTVESLKTAVDNALGWQGAMRAHVESFHDSKKIVKELLECCTS